MGCAAVAADHIQRPRAGSNFANGPISKPVALIAMMFPEEKNGMRVKPVLVSGEAAHRSGGLPTLIPFR
jgi:hypothetical protein